MAHHITSPDQVKAGWYIRAYVNCYGNCAIETVLVKGKPFMQRWYNDKYMLAFQTPNRYDKRIYASDLGATGRQGIRLYPFSNKMMLKLQALRGNPKRDEPVKAFVEFIEQKQYSHAEWINQVMSWKLDHELQNAMHDQMMRSMEERYDDLPTSW